MALRGLEGAIDTKAVSRSRAQARDLAAMDAAVVGRQPHTVGLMLAGLVIEAEIGGVRMRGVERDVGAAGGEGYSERFAQDIFDVVDHAIPPEAPLRRQSAAKQFVGASDKEDRVADMAPLGAIFVVRTLTKAKPRNKKVDLGNANTAIDRRCQEPSR